MSNVMVDSFANFKMTLKKEVNVAVMTNVFAEPEPVINLEFQQRDKLLNQLIDNHYNQHRISKERLQSVEELRQKLQDQIRRDPIFGGRARIDVFGSLGVGLGTNTSKVDLCLRLEDDQKPLNIANKKFGKEYLRDLQCHIQQIGGRVLALFFKAKVPIVKFEWHINKGETVIVDVSYCDVVGLRTTHVIKKYCAFEPDRLPKLIFFVKQWSKTCDIGRKSGGLSSTALTTMLIYYLQNINPPLLPVLQKRGRSKNTSSVAELLVGFFHFYSTFPFEEKLIEIGGSTNPYQDRKFSNEAIGIEDPFRPSINLGSYVERSMANFIKETFLNTCRVLKEDLMQKFPSSDIQKSDSATLTIIEEELLTMCQIDKPVPARKVCEVKHFWTEEEREREFQMQKRRINHLKELEHDFWNFNLKNDEHSGDSFNSIESDEPGPSEHFEARHQGTCHKLLNQIIFHHYDKNRVSQQRLRQVEVLRQILQGCLRSDPNFGEHARLEVFGSLANGLGMNSSDVDFCVRLKEDQLLERNWVLENTKITDMCYPLHRIGCSNVQTILGAKVPIAKFEWNTDTNTKIDGDISYYNVLALYNTKLIKKYCEWEPERMPKLGLFIKQWAKNCDIGSSAQGSLSSYAYSIMLIYYLQNTEPPILPILQKNCNDADFVIEMVMGANVHFIKKVTPNWSKNTSSVAELLVGFFKFYSDFPFDEKLIQIRGVPDSLQNRKFSRSEIRIEDPLILSHNLGNNVKHEMVIFIKKAFITALRVLTVDFAKKYPVILEKHGSARLTSIEENLMKMLRGEDIGPFLRADERNRYERAVPPHPYTYSWEWLNNGQTPNNNPVRHQCSSLAVTYTQWTPFNMQTVPNYHQFINPRFLKEPQGMTDFPPLQSTTQRKAKVNYNNTF